MAFKQALPSYRLHKPSGLAVVRLSGRDVYLGRYGTPESRQRYEAAVAEWLSDRRAAPVPDSCGHGRDPSINELVLAFMEHASRYYTKNGRPTGEAANFKHALRPLVDLYGGVPARGISPMALRSVRDRMMTEGLCRGTINARINRVRRVFRWAVEHELVPISVLHALQAVSPLRRGRTEARESERVRPVLMEIVEATAEAASPTVAAMIRLQVLTGMRPGEVVSMRGRDLETRDDVWVYTPASHKTEHHGRDRTICLGPRAQTVIRPFLGLDPASHLFRPLDAERWHAARRREHRQTPMTPSQDSRQRKPDRMRAPGELYTTSSYARAIAYACRRAFPTPSDLSGDNLRKWRNERQWSPNQLRHTAATELRRRFGLDAARVVLGHRSSDVTEIYAEIDHSKAAEVMAEVG